MVLGPLHVLGYNMLHCFVCTPQAPVAVTSFLGLLVKPVAQGAWRVRERMQAAGLAAETQTCNALIRAAAHDAALAPAARALYEDMRARGPPPDALTLSALYDVVWHWRGADGAWLLEARAPLPAHSMSRGFLLWEGG